MEPGLPAERHSRVPGQTASLDPQATALGVLAGVVASHRVGVESLDASPLLGTAVLLWVVPAIVTVAIVLAHLVLARSPAPPD